MYKKTHVMASFKELRNKIVGNNTEVNSNLKDTLPENINNLELEEARYLLALIAKSDFSGKDIQIVYNVALKLQKIIEDIISLDVNDKR